LIDTAARMYAGVEFTIRHPDDRSQITRVGHDPRRGGAYIEIQRGDVHIAFDEIEMDVGLDPTREILDLLASFGYVGIDDLAAARNWLSRPSCWRQLRPPRRVRRVLWIVRELEDAAGR
jgi:hypothetical protein